jgi:hypothetical protein
MAKDREVEVMEDNHRVEVRVYSQKVKHLEYEHSIALDTIKKSTEGTIVDEAAGHDEREATLRRAKDALKMERKEREFEHATEIQDMKLVRRCDGELWKGAVGAAPFAVC